MNGNIHNVGKTTINHPFGNGLIYTTYKVMVTGSRRQVRATSVVLELRSGQIITVKCRWDLDGIYYGINHGIKMVH
jgi:hypothetical protein